MNRDFERMRKAAQDYTSERARKYSQKPGHGNPEDTFTRIAYVVLQEFRNMSPEMIDAMAKTPWPEEMSARDQMKAMHNAVIDAVLERVESRDLRE